MRFVLSGGGTAGHINPALAVAGELLERGHQVFFAGTPGSQEERLVGQAGIPFTAFEAKGFDRAKKSTLITSGAMLLKSTAKAKAWLKEIEPDGVLGFGSYVSIPVGRAAVSLHLPLLIHEQNSVAGLTNRYLAPKADVVAVTYACSEKDLKTSSPCIVTGNPVRASIFGHDRAASRKLLDIPQDARFLFVFGGSQGARHLNTAIAQCAPSLMEREDLYVFHVTGPKEFDTVTADLQEAGVDFGEGKRWRVFDYFYQMGEALSACDATLARAGATSIAEISSLGVPALLVPFPYARGNHQMLNAQAMVDAGAALVIADDQVETPAFKELLEKLVDDGELRASMRAASLALESGKATARVADLACDLAQGIKPRGKGDECK